MKLVKFRGNNCFYSCLFTLAQKMGIRYTDAASTLLSETDFAYGTAYKAYYSPGLLVNLRNLGLHTNYLPLPAPVNESGLIPGSYYAIGMDPFHIHWTISFGRFNGVHYFLAKMNEDGNFICFDPTYGNQNEPLSREVVTSHAFEIARIESCAKKSFRPDDMEEIAKFANMRDDTLKDLLQRAGGSIDMCSRLERYVDCMINNRMLYNDYIMDRRPKLFSKQFMFSAAYYNDWAAVKYGFLKASNVNENTNLIRTAIDLMRRLMAQELEAARLI